MSWGRKALLLSVLSLLSAPAQAQTSPGFTAGQTLGATQLNNAFIAKQDFPGPTLNVKNLGAVGNGVANDTAAIQAVLTSVGATGGNVILPCGRYLLGGAGTLNVSSNTLVSGYGWCTILIMTATSTQGAIRGTSVSNVIVKDLAVDGTAATSGAPKAFVFQSSSRIRLDHLFVNGASSAGSHLNDGMAFIGSSDALTTNSSVIDVTNACYDQWEGSTDVSFIGNFCDLTLTPVSTAYGILVTGISTALTAATNSRAKIIGNTIRGAKQVGIWVQGGWNNVSGGGAVFGSVVDAVVSDNIIDTVSSFHGIQVSEAARVVVSNNVIRNTQSEGIRVNSQDAADGGTTANITVADNIITGCNLAANDTCLRVGGGAGATNIIVSGNRTSGSYINAVQVSASVPGAKIINNNMDTGSGARISDSGTSTIIVDPQPAGTCTDSNLCSTNLSQVDTLNTSVPNATNGLASWNFITQTGPSLNSGAVLGSNNRLTLASPPAGFGVGTDGYYVGYNNIFEGFPNVGGGVGTEKGHGYSQGTYAYLKSGATNWIELDSNESDFAMQTGSSALYGYGFKYYLLGVHAVAPTNAHIGFLAARATGGLASLTCAFCIGDPQGFNPMAASGTIMKRLSNAGGEANPTITSGIDMTGYTFTGNAFASNGFTVNATGTVAGNFLSALKAVVHQPLTSTGLTNVVGSVSYITNGTAANCGDGTCTTFGTTVSTAAGAGTLPLLIWYNGTAWTLIGK